MSLLHICDTISNYCVFLFVEYLPEDERKCSQHVGGQRTSKDSQVKTQLVLWIFILFKLLAPEFYI